MMEFLIYYILGTLTLFAALIVVLEYVRRKSVENVRASSFNAFLAFYEKKIEDFCKNKGDECKSKLSNLIVRELSRQIEQNKIQYIDIEELYKEVEERVTD